MLFKANLSMGLGFINLQDIKFIYKMTFKFYYIYKFIKKIFLYYVYI